MKNLTVISFESRHAKTMADLIRVHGGNPVLAPALKEVPLENNEQAFSFADKLFRHEIDVLILLTGVGARTLIQTLETRYAKAEILEALGKTAIVPRGPKPMRVLKELGIPFAITVPEPNTWKELLAALDENAAVIPLKDRAVAVQEYGVTNPELLQGLKARGAKVTRVPVYRWALPDDVEPLKNAIRMIIDGKADVVVFTTAVQIEHLFQVAEQMGVAEKLSQAFRSAVVASVGPDCSAAIRARGISVDIEPESPKMGPLMQKTAALALGILEKKRKL